MTTSNTSPIPLASDGVSASFPAPIVSKEVVVPVTPSDEFHRGTQALKDMVAAQFGSSTQIPGSSFHEVKIFSSYVEVKMLSGLTKAIKMEDFVKMLKSTIDVSAQKEGLVFALPSSAYMFSQAGETIHLACYYPSQRSTLSHQSSAGVQTVEGVWMPNVVIYHKLNREDKVWKMVDSRFYATSKTVPELDTTKFPTATGPFVHMPLPNFYDDNRMCYGGNTMPVRFDTNLRGVEYYYSVLSLSPFNNDLVPGSIPDRNVVKWFEHLSRASRYPYEEVGLRVPTGAAPLTYAPAPAQPA